MKLTAEQRSETQKQEWCVDIVHCRFFCDFRSLSPSPSLSLPTLSPIALCGLVIQHARPVPTSLWVAKYVIKLVQHNGINYVQM